MRSTTGTMIVASLSCRGSSSLEFECLMYRRLPTIGTFDPFPPLRATPLWTAFCYVERVQRGDFWLGPLPLSEALREAGAPWL